MCDVHVHRDCIVLRVEDRYERVTKQLQRMDTVDMIDYLFGTR